MEGNENENTTVQTFGMQKKAVLREKYIAVQAYLKKQERNQIYNLNSHLKELERQQQRQPKASRRREIIKSRAEINNTESIKKEQINKSKSWFFEIISKTDKPLARFLKKKRGPKQINQSNQESKRRNHNQ